VAGELGEHGGEGADVAVGGPQFGAAVQQGVELGFVVVGQGVGVPGESAGDLAGGRRGRLTAPLLLHTPSDPGNPEPARDLVCPGGTAK
jgi:hypothetical protein